MLDAYLRKKRERIFVVFSHRKLRVFVGTDETCPDKWWEHDFISEKHPQYPVVAEKLKKYLVVANKVAFEMVKNKVEITAENIREIYSNALEKAANSKNGDVEIRLEFTMLKDLDDFIERRKKFYRYNTLRNYRYSRNVLAEFEEHIGVKLDVDIFSKKTFEQYVSFMLLEKNMLNNTIDKHVTILKTFFAEVYPTADRSFIKYGTYIPDIIAMTEDELMQLIGIPANGVKEKAKDLFVFLATTGFRISDCHKFNPNWITDELIIYSANKTMSKAYVPLLDTAKSILEKYGGYPPRMNEQHFNRELKKLFFDCGFTRPIILRHRQGRYELEEIKPLFEVVSSHTGRKTFISMMLARGIPIQDVMNMSGHQDYRSMRPYIHVNQQHMRDYKNKIGL